MQCLHTTVVSFSMIEGVNISTKEREKQAHHTANLYVIREGLNNEASLNMNFEDFLNSANIRCCTNV